MERKSLWMTLLVGGLLVFVGLSHNGTQHVDAQVAEFDGTAAEEECYWYSRYNLGSLVMRSGLGETFMPEMEMVEMMVNMADADADDGDTAMPPTNAALLLSVYASGDPHYTQQMDVADFATQRWNAESFDKTVTTRAMGWTMIKEIEWAKQFHVDDHFGTPSDNFGAQWRFVGLVLSVEAKMQTQFALQMLMNEDGLFANSDGTVDWGGQWVMLEALSDLGELLDASVLPNSATNRYHDPETAAMFMGAADMLFAMVAGRLPADTEELSLAIQALTWYAASTKNAGNQAQAIDLIASYGDNLIGADTPDATSKSHDIRGLIDASRITGDGKYLVAAVSVFDDLAAEYDETNRVFSSQNSYTIDDVAVILGALNSLRIFGSSDVDRVKVLEIFTNFFENVVNISGLQVAAPPKNVSKGLFEQDDPDIYYAYPGMPMPPMAGGDFGIAPVFATEVTWDGSEWSVTNGRFDTAGAMHASNEMIWFHHDEVNGFPEVGIITSVKDASDDSAALPGGFKLFQNHPNPFNPETIIGYQLTGDAHVTINFYNTSGQLVKTLVDDVQKAGIHTVKWDGRDDNGTRVASGIYLYRMEARTGPGTVSFVETRKMVLLE